MTAADPAGMPAKDTENHREDLSALLMWLPLPMFLAAIVALQIAEPFGPFEHPYLLLALNFTCSFLASTLVIVLLARMFVLKGKPDILLFGCGLVVWAVLTASAASSGVSRW